MDDLHSILEDYRKQKRRVTSTESLPPNKSGQDSTAEIPNLFFDKILVEYKLSRIDIIVLMYLYRQVWCWPNLYRDYGISQLLSHTEMSKRLKISIEEIHSAIRKLEELFFVETVRSGQYFVRRFFTKEDDDFFEQSYSDFDN